MSRAKDYDRQYYQKNRDKIIEKSKRYYQKNKKSIIKKSKKYHKKYYQKNKDTIDKYNRNYYQRNKETLLERIRNKNPICAKCGFTFWKNEISIVNNYCRDCNEEEKNG